MCLIQTLLAFTLRIHFPFTQETPQGMHQ